jgi:hypothetical protein
MVTIAAGQDAIEESGVNVYGLPGLGGKHESDGNDGVGIDVAHRLHAAGATVNENFCRLRRRVPVGRHLLHSGIEQVGRHHPVEGPDGFFDCRI